jgi:hypothetical protein
LAVGVATGLSVSPSASSERTLGIMLVIAWVGEIGPHSY